MLLLSRLICSMAAVSALGLNVVVVIVGIVVVVVVVAAVVKKLFG